MTDRVQLGWRIPADVWEQFEAYVHDKHGATGPYLRFEIECAMREYLDEDGVLAEAESLLREVADLSGLSSSTVVATDRYRGSETTKLAHRINAALKERFQGFAKDHDTSAYGRVLAAALDSYTEGGRARRILDGVKRVITGGTTSGTSDESVESVDAEATESTTIHETVDADLSTVAMSGTSGGTEAASVTVEPRAVMEIADDLPPATFPSRVLDEAIEDVVDADDPRTIEQYRDAVLDHVDAGEHPHNAGIYVTDAFREERTLWADLDRAERIVLLRRFAAAEALDREDRRRAFTYTDVMTVFEEWAGGGSPSHQYAYELMEAAADETGFEYDEFHGQLQLRVDLTDVSDAVLEWALDAVPDSSLEGLSVNGRITAYTAGSPPTQEGAADD